jgi:CheY-like chemotaxis protein
VVEDEASVRDLVRRTLLACGYRTLTASNAGEALLLWEKHHARIDLLLTDVVMPHASGRELSERLRSERPDLPVLFMSGYTDSEIDHHGVLLPGVAFLAKPFTPTVLAHKVREVLSASDRQGQTGD